MPKYPAVLREEVVKGKRVEMINEGPSFGLVQVFVYVNGRQFGPSAHTREKADNVFNEAVDDIRKGAK